VNTSLVLCLVLGGLIDLSKDHQEAAVRHRRTTAIQQGSSGTVIRKLRPGTKGNSNAGVLGKNQQEAADRHKGNSNSC
jgi:hypothetical protein